MSNKRLIYFFFISLFLISIPFISIACVGKPLLWDMDQLERMKKDLLIDEDAQHLVKLANSCCATPPLAVTVNKKISYGPNDHYYCSIGPYRWPDPNNPGGYIPKDGVVNPDWKYYDGCKMADMVLRCEILSKAFFLTNESKYYDAYIRQIRTWFLDGDTYMEPNFEFAQINTDTHVGQSQGMIESYVFNTLIESLRLVNSIKRIDRKTLVGMKDWFRNFGNWADNKYGSFFPKVNNNISLAYDVTITHIFLFCGEKRKAKKIADNFAQKRIYTQICEDGRQPEELTRTRAFYYSIYNISHVLDFCFIAKTWDKRYYEKYGERVEKAFDYLKSFVDNPDLFPYQQITSWDECIMMYNEALIRRDRLVK